MKGTLCIVPADKTASVERREISAPPSGADLHEIVGGYIEVVPGFTKWIERMALEEGHSELVSCVAFCNEDGKRLGLAHNFLATSFWQFALKYNGHPGLLQKYADGTVTQIDYLVGNIAIVTGDAELMEAL